MRENTAQTSQKKDWLNDFVERNLWAIIMLVIGGAIFYATISSSVTANAKEIDDLNKKVDSLQSLVERIIILEEHDKTFAEDLSEMKTDLKSIGRAVGAKNLDTEE